MTAAVRIIDVTDVAGKVVAPEWLARAERPVREAWLDPPLLATYYGEDLLERRPVPLGEISPGTVRAVLAAEDSSFFEHPGISFTGNPSVPSSRYTGSAPSAPRNSPFGSAHRSFSALAT